ncbi:hypothetical protein BFR69_02135 [Acinetobacter pittii]|uniref:hypothetical protein n=1 Tax=Acinetobacter TaxID=469 RepID=UPI00031491B1|nr:MULTISPECIES: hypothetical protein [Acinetobacter]EXI19297.1 hypothetical protein J610_0475 [Acinetobacter sp. 723929]KQE99792.1 hypothetical protein APB99_13760 [Acinetobacter pittii]KRI16158.1 hypothetical protein APC96_07845 [Acinetobacter pittii]KRI32977.1 hypothetical protein APB87_18170 [Acinetobacter pittii]KRJ09189.1 hypothetical protein APC76_18745 [Acinetobacter pittii]
MTTFKEAQNYAKQIKNAKRGGYTPTIAKDVNKHIKQKLIKLDNHFDELFNEKWAEWKNTADMHAQGFADGIEYAQRQIQELLK